MAEPPNPGEEGWLEKTPSSMGEPPSPCEDELWTYYYTKLTRKIRKLISYLCYKNMSYIFALFR